MIRTVMIGIILIMIGTEARIRLMVGFHVSLGLAFCILNPPMANPDHKDKVLVKRQAAVVAKPDVSWWNPVRFYSSYKILCPKRRMQSYSLLGTIIFFTDVSRSGRSGAEHFDSSNK